MKAIWYENLGEARDVLKFGEVPKPEPQKGEVQVRLKFSGVNPSDVKRRMGRSAVQTRYPRVIPHNDGSGIIDAVGDDISPSRIGERVWIYEAQINRPYGTAAEYVVVPSWLAVPLSGNADFEIAASLGVPAMTAHQCVFSDGSVKGQTVLVSGGAGSVGFFAIQLAKWGGAKVITTVSSSEKAAVAIRANPDYVVNYRSEIVRERVREITNQEGVDRIVEVAFGSNLNDDIDILKRDGAIAAYASDAIPSPTVPFYSLMPKNPKIRFVLVYSMSKAAHEAAVSDINTCLRDNFFVSSIGKKFPLSDTVVAHEAVESGATGKILVELG